MTTLKQDFSFWNLCRPTNEYSFGFKAMTNTNLMAVTCEYSLSLIRNNFKR